MPLPPHGGPEADLIHAVLSGVHLGDHGKNEPVVGLLPHACVSLVQGKTGGPQMANLHSRTPCDDTGKGRDECKMLPVLLTRGAEGLAGSYRG
nr:hypothetical protein [uncultured Cohaesibacter sp.]